MDELKSIVNKNYPIIKSTIELFLELICMSQC